MSDRGSHSAQERAVRRVWWSPRRGLRNPCALLVVLVMAISLVPGPSAEAQVVAAGPTLVVDAGADHHPISDRIYGINSYLLDPQLAVDLALPVERSGGDGAVEYNWELGSTGYAANWYYEVFADAPGEGPDDVVARSRAADREVMLTLPALGWVAGTRGSGSAPGAQACAYSVAKYGPQIGSDPNVEPDCGAGWVCPAGRQFRGTDGRVLDPDADAGRYGFGDGVCVDPTRPGEADRPAPTRVVGNDPTDASICPGGRPDPVGDPYRCDAPADFDRRWVAALVAEHGTAAAGGVDLYSLDNEPNLWATTHAQVHPQCVTWQELVTKHLAVAAAAKAADPTAEVVGPATSGYPGSIDVEWKPAPTVDEPSPTCSIRAAHSPERAAHGGIELARHYLRAMASHEARTGIRVLDYFDQHHYPAQPGVALAPAGDATTQARRLASTRSLWDPTYTEHEDGSWLADVYDRPGERFSLQLIRRMESWAAEYPGTKTAITEYNFGGTESVNGALAQADVLGIFAREGLDMAMFWPANGDGRLTAASPGANGFRAFRNYDGGPADAGGRFGDTWVMAHSDGPTQAGQDRLAVYAARRSSDGALTIVVVNKSTSDLRSPLTVAGFASQPTAEVHRYSAADPSGFVPGDPVPTGPGGAITLDYPASSITVLELQEREVSEEPVPTTFDVRPVFGRGGHGSLLRPTATLRDARDGAPVPGREVRFTAGSARLCVGRTGPDGVATCRTTLRGLLAVLGNLGYTATFAGDATHAATTRRVPLFELTVPRR